MAIDALIKTVLSELKVAINSKTVIGEPTTFKNWTVIPVTKVSFGFGAGGGHGKNDSASFGGGSGGGATIEPVAFIAINEKEVKLISLKEKETIWEKILKPEVGEKIYNKLMGIADTPETEPSATTEPNDSGKSS
ncbi:MAG: sporulation protein [Erysipelotrichia bacterium]|nr:spore germination protein GerW family protein [Candidatus Riflebacteria bacterium]NCB39752.1 sporulation protein [Erysipelotrichia bacterium]